jgi:hypothetical protein
MSDLQCKMQWNILWYKVFLLLIFYSQLLFIRTSIIDNILFWGDLCATISIHSLSWMYRHSSALLPRPVFSIDYTKTMQFIFIPLYDQLFNLFSNNVSQFIIRIIAYTTGITLSLSFSVIKLVFHWRSFSAI